MSLACHHLCNCQTYGNAIAVWHGECSFKALHGASLVCQQTQSLSRGYQYATFRGLRICCLEFRQLSRLLCELHIMQGLLSIFQLSISTCKLRVDDVVVWRKI